VTWLSLGFLSLVLSDMGIELADLAQIIADNSPTNDEWDGHWLVKERHLQQAIDCLLQRSVIERPKRTSLSYFAIVL
jgi:hypothetical protein